jgi:pantetheine-phosphate adenylyltransferase
LADQKKRIAIYPGTFDPITYGHLDVLERAARLFDEVIISVSESSAKKTLLSVDRRVKLIRKVIKGIGNAKTESFKGLLVNYAKSKNAKVIIRGLRAISDFEYEFQMALTNRKIASDIETVFLMPHEKYSFISSSLVREIVFLGGDISSFVPPEVAESIKKIS